jgi:uncharacterized damage-inducible protein DinB
MSATAASDAKTIAVKYLKNAFWRFRVDLLAIPEEAMFKSFGGCSRSVADLVYETDQVNKHICQGVRGETQFDWVDVWLKAPETWKTKQDVVDAFTESSEQTIKTFEDLSLEELEAPYEDEGKMTTRMERCRFITFHTDYHSGQINFVQSLLGDDKFHWMAG